MNIIITGAGKGIGYEIVRKFEGMGDHKVIAVSRDLSAWNKKQHSNILPFTLDLEEPGASKKLAEFAKQQLDYIDILVNNAGYLINKLFTEFTEEDFDRQFNVNVRSAFLNIQSLFHVFSQGSHVVNISSMGGFQGSVKYPGLSLYSASKAALASLTESLALELKGAGISMNCLALGAVQTEMLAEAFPNYKAPLNASEIADFIAYFALNGHRYFNGKIIPVALSTP